MASQEHCLKVVLGLLPAVVLSLVATVVTSASAKADCASAMQRYDDAAHDENAQSVAKLRELGVPPEPVPIEKSCENLQYLQWRLPQEQGLIALLNAERAECANVSLVNGDYPERILAVIQSQIPVFAQQCQQYRARQVSVAPPPSTASAPSNQSSCSTITGPGMTGGPTNCTPGQPYPVTASPQQPTQTAAAPPPAPTNPLDPATQAAQQIFGMLNLPVPQLQPTPAADPEAPARAAFDRGQAAFNAHDCATALQYFNQAVALTVSYGSTYSGWRDRAQACAGQVATEPAPAPAAAPSSTCAPGHDADIQSANTLLQIGAAQEALGTCTSLNDAAVAYRNAAAWLLRAVVELPRDDFCRNKADETLRKSTAIDYRREQQCAGQANQPPPPNCTSQLQAMHQLEDRARSGPNMGAVGQTAQVDQTIMNQANILKVQLAAQGCRDSNAPLSLRECLAASLSGIDKATLQKAGCPP